MSEEERWRRQEVRVDAESKMILEAIERNFGEPLEVTEGTRASRTYTLISEGIDRLVLSLSDDAIRILNIEATNPGGGYAVRAVEAIVETADEIGCEVWAEDVKPGADEWWRERGFAPQEGEEYSADYMYREE